MPACSVEGKGLVTMFQRLVMDAVNSVALPYFAKQSRESQNLERIVYGRDGTHYRSWAGRSFSVSHLMAYPAIRILYGPQWDDAVDPARWLAIACVFSIPAAICPPPLIADRCHKRRPQGYRIFNRHHCPFCGVWRWTRTSGAKPMLDHRCCN